MRAIEQTLHTSGDGWWSTVSKEVNITGLELSYEADLEEDETECQFGELRVHFDRSWDVNEHGLIYTDKRFLLELKEYLTRSGYNASDIGYSEQGMQGEFYVSLDLGPNFIRSWKAIK